jgi:inhibitor of cysteine peptidase
MQELELTENDQGRTCNIIKGDYVTIRLAEIPTTGYRWAVKEFNDQILVFEESNYLISRESQIGGGGLKIFRFLAISPGQSNLILKLEREWENDAIKVFDITVNVN